MRGSIVAAVVVGAFAPCVSAGYMLSPLVGGTASEISVLPGQAFGLDFMLTSDAGDVHRSAVFQAEFSAGGLVLESYSWASPYDNGTIDDFSTPHFSALPATIDGDSFVSGANPPGTVDIDLQNVLAAGSPSFGSGRLITLQLRVPADWAGPSDVTIRAIPDEFFNFGAGGGSQVPAGPGGLFTVNIIPTPGALGLVPLLLAVGSVRKRN